MLKLSTADLESPESEKLTDSVSEKEEKEVEEVEESSVTDISVLAPVRRRQRKREELPAGWERHEVSENKIFSKSEL